MMEIKESTDNLLFNDSNVIEVEEATFNTYKLIYILSYCKKYMRKIFINKFI